MKKIRRIKGLSFGIKEKGGRNRGKISMPRRGSLVKRLYRFIDTKRSLYSETGLKIINKYLYDPNRTGYISVIAHPDGVISYILAAQYYKAQERVYNLMRPPVIHDRGWSETINNIPKGKIIFNVELVPGFGGKVVKTGGNSAVLLRKDNRFGEKAVIKLRSGEHRFINKSCIACVGAVSNFVNFLKKLKKAGSKRLLGFRPRVRPSVMNPVDHPMGGRTKGGCAPCDRKRFPSIGRFRVKNIKSSFIFVSSRRARKNRIS